MTVWECNGCPHGTCTLINIDPDFDIDEQQCMKKGSGSTIAVWRELVAQ